MAARVKLAILSLLLLCNIIAIIQSSKLFKKSKMAITDDRNRTKEICIDHGAGDENLLCRSIDKRTNRIYAHGICKGVIKNLKKVDVKFTEFEVTFCQKYLTNKHKRTTKMARCEYKDEITYVAHAKSDYYYVLTDCQTPVAVMTIKIDPKDYEPIIFRETNDRLEADNIFGFHGVGEFKNTKVVGHVCNPTSKGAKTIIGEKHCKFVLKKLKLDTSSGPTYETNCGVVNLVRYIPGVCDGVPAVVGKLQHAKCSYPKKRKNRGDYAKETILITNAKEKGYYYISESLKDLRIKVDVYVYYVVRVMHIPDSEIFKL